MSKHVHSLLCLGDSYTVGEGVPLFESFPYQLMQLMRKKGVAVHAPEIVAKTGWTTFELADYLIHHQFQSSYDFVTLLIGVNNQYRDLDPVAYQEEFEFLLRKALHLANNNAQHVIVLSIPDWGATPFAKGKKVDVIANAIDAFNAINQSLAHQYLCSYVDITTISREQGEDDTMVTSDGLHPAGKMYALWAEKLATLLYLDMK